MMRPWLTGIISNLSGTNTHLLMAYFLPPRTVLQRKKAREIETLGSAYAFSPLSFPKHPLLSPQDPSWFLNSHQVPREGEILFLRLFVGEEIDAICLPLFYPPSGLDLTEGRNEGVHPVVSRVLYTSQYFAQRYYFRVCCHLLEIWGATSVCCPNGSPFVFKELLKKKPQENK